MKQVFELYINGKFTQYLMKSEVRLLKWDKFEVITLIPVEMDEAKYKFWFNKFN